MEDTTDYQTIIDRLFTGETERHVKDGLAISLPIPGILADRRVDCFFLYALARDREQAHAPTAMLKLDSSDGRLLHYQKVPPARRIRSDRSRQSGDIPTLMSRYKALYPIVRGFAFDSPLAYQQTDVLATYMGAFKALTNTEFRAIYETLAPEFFSWAERMLIETPDQSVGGP